MTSNKSMNTNVLFVLFLSFTNASFAGNQSDLIFKNSLEQLYTITYTAGANGSITGSSSQNIEQGSDGTAITILEGFGHSFTGWSDGVTDNPRTDTNVQSDITVTALYEINTYTLTYTAGNNGSITGESPQIVDFETDGTQVTAVADTGFHFVDWSDASVVNPRTDTFVQLNVSVTANFTVDAVTFGQAGTHTLAAIYQEPTELATIYYPTDASAVNKVPVVFLAPGFANESPSDYDTILRFIASHGFAAVFIEDNDEFDFSSTDMIVDAIAMVADKSDILDTTRIGVFGHSSGGGYAFNILDKLSDVQGWGANGRFIFISEGWFAFDMMQIDMRSLPSNTNVVMQEYDGPGGVGGNDGTDARIVLTEYYLLESIADDKKDYQIDVNGNHSYPYGQGGTQADYDGISIILEPLDALMQYTFVDSNNIVAHDAALELGNDDPYADGNGIQEVLPRGSMQYPCNGVDFTVEDIDYCDIKGYPYSSQFDYLATNNNTVQPILGGMSTTDVEFGTTITRLTERVLQQDHFNGAPLVNKARGNHHPYPKTQAWNADMTMVRLNFRLYDADTLLEIPLSTTSGNYPLTTNTWNTRDLYYINGALNEKKWSTVDPNVFYGIYLTWDKKGQVYKGTIDRAAQTIIYDLMHSFGTANAFEKFSLGKFEGNIDFNDQYVALVGRKFGGTFITVIVYDMINDTFVEKDFDGNNGNAIVNWTENPVPQEFDWISVSPLGNHIIMSTSGNLEQYDMNLNYIGQLSDEATHGDMGIAQNGEEVFVSFKFTAPQGIFAHRLQKFVDEVNDPAPNVVANYHHQLLPEKYNGGHISCRNYQRPGWCYLSTVAEGHREISALRINFGHHSLNVVNRFAQTQTSTQTSTFGSVSPDGKRVLFYTDWEDAGLNYYDRDTYQAQRVD